MSASLVVAGVIWVSTLSGQAIPIHLDRIIQMESSGDPKAFKENEKARGLFQIRECVLQEFNHYGHPGLPNEVQPNDLFDAEINLVVASWYLSHRIPMMLLHYKRPITLENIIISWNAGIKYTSIRMKRRLSSGAKKYFKKYRNWN